jgi:hypothetical protein
MFVDLACESLNIVHVEQGYEKDTNKTQAVQDYHTLNSIFKKLK